MSSVLSRGQIPRRILALASATVLTVGIGVVAAPSAFAADPDTSTSQASAQYLSGSWNSPGVSASFDGSTMSLPGAPGAPVAQSGALASLIAGSGINIGIGSEYAQAATDGKSWAASGRVTAAGVASKPANVTIDLGKILKDAGIADVTEKFTLDLQEITGIAALDAGNAASLATTCADWSAPDHCRDYTLKSGSLKIESDALAAAMAEIHGLAAALDAAIGDYYNGPVSAEIADLLISPINGWLADNIIVKTPKTTGFTEISVTASALIVKVSGSVASALATILAAEHTVNGVTLNLGSGKIDVDYDAVMGGLNGLPPNSPLFGSAAVASISASLNQIIDDLAAEISDAIQTLLDAITVTATGSATGSAKFETWLPATRWTPAFKLGETHSTLSANIEYTGTLRQLLHGGGGITVGANAADPIVNAAVQLALLAIPQPIDLETLLPGGIFGGAVDAAIEAAVDAVADGAKSIGGAAVASIAGALNSASSVFGGTINVQKPGPVAGSYQETALNLWFGPNGHRATVDLGTAIVGPNSLATETPGGDMGGGDTGGGDSGSTGGTTPTTPDTTTPATPDVSTPAVEVQGESNEIIALPISAVVQPSIEVQGENYEVIDAANVLAETGPHETGLIALLGLELLLGGIAISRLTSRHTRRNANRAA